MGNTGCSFYGCESVKKDQICPHHTGKGEMLGIISGTVLIHEPGLLDEAEETVKFF